MSKERNCSPRAGPRKGRRAREIATHQDKDYNSITMLKATYNYFSVQLNPPLTIIITCVDP